MSDKVLKGNKVHHVHLTAICGTGMGALAGMLKAEGLKVTGSDHNVYPPVSTFLEKMRIPVYEGYKAENIKDMPDCVIIGNAIRRDNPEAAAIMEAGIEYTSMPDALRRFFLDGKEAIVVTGTHGKTTTAALASWLLYFAEEDPGFLVGGILRNFGSSYRIGKGKYFVVEGDEYDTAFFDKSPKFLKYSPFHTILTSIEFDHADIYKNIDHLKENFESLVEIIPPSGQLICSSDYPAIREVIQKKQPNCPVLFYGKGNNPDWYAKDVENSHEGMKFRVFKEGAFWGEFVSPIYGEHNLANILSVLALMEKIGIPLPTLQEGLKEFKGIKRRQEVFEVVAGVPIIDDFAHHPTAVKATIASVRERFPEKRIWAIFEPRTNTSRRNFFQKEYADAFSQADFVFIAPVFNSSKIPDDELLNTDKLVCDICAHGVDAVASIGVDEIVDKVSSQVATGDVILIMSNGGFSNIYHSLPQAMKTRFGRQNYAKNFL